MTYPGSASAKIDPQVRRSLHPPRPGPNCFGTVNNGTTHQGTVNVVTTAASGLLTDCVDCNGPTVGQCGKAADSIAIYARGF